jgi:serine/threonine-protein kinase
MAKPAFRFEDVGKGEPIVLGGKYRLLGHLGSGGMATVYRAVHADTGGAVAVKIMHRPGKEALDTTSSADEANDLLRRFQREARLAGSVDTEHIVRVYDAGLDDATDSPYMVMELLHGEDVASLIRRLGPLREDLALRITAQTAIGLAKAHHVGVVHRDIKPSNLFLSAAEYGRCTLKLLDFGIAKSTGTALLDAHDSRTLTQTGMMLGSPHYMSPEQVMGARTIDARTDIWSLGVVLFKALTARTPNDDCDTMGHIIVQVVSEDAPSVQDFAPWVSPAVAAIVRRALARKAADRYQTAEEMFEALRELLKDGWDLNAAMFTPMTDDERGVIRSRRPAPAAPLEGDATRIVPLDANIADVPGRGYGGARLRNAALVTAALLGVGAAAWLATHRVTPPVPAQMPVAVSASVGQAPQPIQPRVMTAEVSIVPASSVVDVDGVATVVANGTIVIDGTLGTVRRVHVVDGPRETTVEVILTSAGARPNRVVLEAPAAPAPARSVGVRRPVHPSTAPSASTTSPPVNKRPDFQQTFE